jgi:iron complex outermembrane recepter protein
MPISFRQGAMSALCIVLYPSIGYTQQPAAPDAKPAAHVHHGLEEVVVTANPLARATDDLSQSATVLQGEALRQQLANTLGETLARTPGLSNASFGENIGRPVIRGLQGSRVGVLSNSMALNDASAVSQDHAVAVEPFLADQIEVLRGPSTLLFGSGAIGGVVNTVSPTIPQAIPENGYSGRVTTQANTAADEEFAAGRLDLGGGSFALHVDGFHRRTEDYDIPGNARLYPEDEHEHEHEDEHEDEHEGEHEDEHGDEGGDSGVLDNSYLKNEGATLGGSWIGEQWRLGAAYTEYKSDYGIPGGTHAHGHEEEHEDEEHEGEEHEEEEEAPVSIDLKSKRSEVELAGSDPIPGFEQFKVRFVDTDYEHTEFEGSEVGTVFNSDSNNTRMELKHDPWGVWQGVFGLQYTDVDFSAVGAEAFLPGSTTKTAAAFWIEHADIGDWQFDVGMRYDDVDIDVPNTLVPEEGSIGPGSDADFAPFSASAGAIWHINDTLDLVFSVAHAERAPNVDELYANGPHIATQVFEIGDANLDKEANLHFEVGARATLGQFTASASVFSDNFNDYIYQEFTGEEEDGLPVALWLQQDAEFVGGEVELAYDFEPIRYGNVRAFAFGDIVEGELSNNDNVPLQPPARTGLGIDWEYQGFSANTTWIHAFKQDNTAPFETDTPSYDLLNAELAYTMPNNGQLDWQVYVQGQNLIDEDIRNSTSTLKDFAPQIGRNVIVGVRMYF